MCQAGKPVIHSTTIKAIVFLANLMLTHEYFIMYANFFSSNHISIMGFQESWWHLTSIQVNDFYWIFFQIGLFPMLRISIFLKLTPGNLRFFLKFWHTPWNSNNFYFTIQEFTINTLDRWTGVTMFFSFLEKPITLAR